MNDGQPVPQPYSRVRLLAALTGAAVTVASLAAVGGSIVAKQADTQDGIALLGRAGGTSSFVATLTPGTLTASRTITVPDLTGTMAVSGAAQAVTFASVTATGNIVVGTPPPSSYSYIITDSGNDGTLIFQNGPGSAAFGGSLWLHGSTHATRAGWVTAGLSAQSGAKFTIHNSAQLGGADVFTVDRTGVTVIGTDPNPSGSELLRVGGVIRVGATLNLQSAAANNELILSNSKFDGTFRAIVTGAGSLYQMSTGYHYWYTIGSVSAGEVQTPVTRMVLDSSGNLGIGVTPTDGNGAIQLASHTTKAGGIAFGTDTFLHRSAGGVLNLIGIAGPAYHLVQDSTGVQSLLLYQSSTQGIIGTQASTPLLFRTGSTVALTIDTSQGATFASHVTASDDVVTLSAFYVGDRLTDGSWRIRVGGSTLYFDRRESGSWVNKSTITA